MVLSRDKTSARYAVRGQRTRPARSRKGSNEQLDKPQEVAFYNKEASRLVKRTKGKRKEKKVVREGIAHIKSTFNNTIVQLAIDREMSSLGQHREKWF